MINPLIRRCYCYYSNSSHTCPAQSVEHESLNLKIVGLSPMLGTKTQSLGLHKLVHSECQSQARIKQEDYIRKGIQPKTCANSNMRIIKPDSHNEDG